MIFSRSHTNRTVATSSSSEAVVMSATRARMIGKVRTPGIGVWSESQIEGVPTGWLILSPAASERAVSS